MIVSVREQGGGMRSIAAIAVDAVGAEERAAFFARRSVKQNSKLEQNPRFPADSVGRCGVRLSAFGAACAQRAQRYWRACRLSRYLISRRPGFAALAID